MPGRPSSRSADAAARQDSAHQKTSWVRTSSRSRRMRVPRSRSFILRARRSARATAWVSKGLTVSAPAASCGAAPANSESTSAPRQVGGAVLLGHQVHAGLERRDQGDVRGPVVREQLVGLRLAVEIVHRHPARTAERAVDLPDQALDLRRAAPCAGGGSPGRGSRTAPGSRAPGDRDNGRAPRRRRGASRGCRGRGRCGPPPGSAGRPRSGSRRAAACAATSGRAARSSISRASMPTGKAPARTSKAAPCQVPRSDQRPPPAGSATVVGASRRTAARKHSRSRSVWKPIWSKASRPLSIRSRQGSCRKRSGEGNGRWRKKAVAAGDSQAPQLEGEVHQQVIVHPDEVGAGGAAGQRPGGGAGELPVHLEEGLPVGRLEIALAGQVVEQRPDHLAREAAVAVPLLLGGEHDRAQREAPLVDGPRQHPAQPRRLLLGHPRPADPDPAAVAQHGGQRRDQRSAGRRHPPPLAPLAGEEDGQAVGDHEATPRRTARRRLRVRRSGAQRWTRSLIVPLETRVVLIRPGQPPRFERSLDAEDRPPDARRLKCSLCATAPASRAEQGCLPLGQAWPMQGTRPIPRARNGKEEPVRPAPRASSRVIVQQSAGRPAKVTRCLPPSPSTRARSSIPA